MAFNLPDLDARTRHLMIEEINLDQDKGTLYKSKRLTAEGHAEYPALLLDAANHGDPESLAAAIQHAGILKSHEVSGTANGGSTVKQVRFDAAEVLAEGEFNRFYIRALCRRAIEDGLASVVVFRAKDVAQPRAGSESRLGARVAAGPLLADLRSRPGVETALGVPGGPGSGISVKLAGTSTTGMSVPAQAEP